MSFYAVIFINVTVISIFFKFFSCAFVALLLTKYKSIWVYVSKQITQSYLVPPGLFETLANELYLSGTIAANTSYSVLCVSRWRLLLVNPSWICLFASARVSLPLLPPSGVQFIARLTGFDARRRSSCHMNLLHLTVTVSCRLLMPSPCSGIVAYKECTHSNEGQSQKVCQTIIRRPSVSLSVRWCR